MPLYCFSSTFSTTLQGKEDVSDRAKTKLITINIGLCILIYSINDINGSKVMIKPNGTFNNLDSPFYYFY